jgi:protoheme ferro-lyase
MDKTKDVVHVVHIEDKINTYCTCDKYIGSAHTCPFKEEIHGDYKSKCKCCSYCENECLRDI